MADIFILKVSCDNDAFTDGGRDDELVRILRETADKIERLGASGFFETIHDINGNAVGSHAVKPRDYFTNHPLSALIGE